jgi:dTDP-4-dehydrorhamnose 3,5-epimerase
MILTETPLPGAFVIDVEPHVDERGFFARTWDVDQFAALGLSTAIVQCSVAFNHRAGTLRGMHYQEEPFGEVKIVRCTSGAIFDVIVDLRSTSPTYMRHYGVTLSAKNRRALYVPIGFAHGYQTLEDESEASYLMSAAYAPHAARGVRWDDPAFAIEWPPAVERVISARDRTYPDYQPS